MNRFIICAVLFFCAAGLFAAPLEGGYYEAPKASAPPEEKAQAFLQAREKVIDAAKKYENTPYLYGGMTKSGLDCSGFICLSFQDALGVSLPRSASGLYSWAEKIPHNMAQPGDFLFFKTDTTGQVSHVALYLGDDRFIHSASAGDKTGVIYSNLNEQYWQRAFVGAGRAFPEGASKFQPASGNVNVNENSAGVMIETGKGAKSSVERGGILRNSASSNGSGRLLLGAAFAPSWNGFLKGGDLFRGFASQIRLGAETYTFGPRMIFGLEVRPEYDGALGVFRIPITFSWGPSDKFMIFAGPVFSFGDASLSTDDGERKYSGGTSWLGAAGITAAPFIFNTAAGEFAPYIEAAWQYYISEEKNRNINADFSAGFRFSTGIRWTIQIN